MRVIADSGLIKVIPGLMIWTLVAFGLTFWGLKRFAFGPVQKAIDDRRDRIRAAIVEAENARDEARKLLEEHRSLIGQARGEAEQPLVEARRGAAPRGARVREEIGAARRGRLEETSRQIEAE